MEAAIMNTFIVLQQNHNINNLLCLFKTLYSNTIYKKLSMFKKFKSQYNEKLFNSKRKQNNLEMMCLMCEVT